MVLTTKQALELLVLLCLLCTTTITVGASEEEAFMAVEDPSIPVSIDLLNVAETTSWYKSETCSVFQSSVDVVFLCEPLPG